MDIKALSQYRNPLIGFAIVIIFAIIVQGIFSHYSLEKEEIASKMRKLEEGEQTIMRWERLSLDAEEIGRSFLTKDTLFFKKFVEEKANSFGIKITSLKTSSVEKDLYWEAKMQLGMDCSYKDFTAFVKAVEEKGVAVERVRIISGQNVRDEKIDLALKGFIIKK